LDLPFVASQPNHTLAAFACTNLLVEEFVERLDAAGYLKETVVVIQSDHLSMRNEVWSELNDKPRDNMLIVLGAGRSGMETRESTMMDVFPTVLDALGYHLPASGAGLGRSLLKPMPTLLERHPLDGFDHAITVDQALRERLWNLSPQKPEDLTPSVPAA
jgi:phosphoglycerol transferase